MTSNADPTAALSTAPDPAQVVDVAETTNWRRAFFLREVRVFHVLIVLILVLSVATTRLGRPNDLSAANFTNVFCQSSLVAVMATAMTSS